LPAKIQALEAEQARLQADIGDSDLFRATPRRAAEILERLAALGADIETAYARWQALESGGRSA
jgi:ATP-binding cassette subfamily F protein uup